VRAGARLRACRAELRAARPTRERPGQPGTLGGLPHPFEAEALFRKAEPHPLARLGQAALALDRGKPLEASEAAAAVVDRYRGRLRLERATALELLARADAALGQLDDAAARADELEELASAAGSEPLRASAALARGAIALAAGDFDGARRLCSEAADLYAQNHLPFEAAHARLALAAALAAVGRDDAADAEKERAHEALAALGVTGRRRGDGSRPARSRCSGSSARG
jgi:tetratricopeptide (TPR) repeat protein